MEVFFPLSIKPKKFILKIQKFKRRNKIKIVKKKIFFGWIKFTKATNPLKLTMKATKLLSCFCQTMQNLTDNDLFYNTITKNSCWTLLKGRFFNRSKKIRIKCTYISSNGNNACLSILRKIGVRGLCVLIKSNGIFQECNHCTIILPLLSIIWSFVSSIDILLEAF